MENLIKEIKNQVEEILLENPIDGFQPSSESWDDPIGDLSHDPKSSWIEIDAEDYSSLEVESILDALISMKHVYSNHVVVHARRDQPWADSDEEIVVVSVINGYKRRENRNGPKGWLVYEMDLGLWDREDALSPTQRREGVGV